MRIRSVPASRSGPAAHHRAEAGQRLQVSPVRRCHPLAGRGCAGTRGARSRSQHRSSHRPGPPGSRVPGVVVGAQRHHRRPSSCREDGSGSGHPASTEPRRVGGTSPTQQPVDVEPSLLLERPNRQLHLLVVGLGSTLFLRRLAFEKPGVREQRDDLRDSRSLVTRTKDRGQSTLQGSLVGLIGIESVRSLLKQTRQEEPRGGHPLLEEIGECQMNQRVRAAAPTWAWRQRSA